jgi:hypothetical protein
MTPARARALTVRIIGSLSAAFIAITMLMIQANQPQDVGYIAPTPDPVTQLIAEHGCWSGNAPADMAGKFPGHAIVNGRYVGHRLADLALDQTLGGHDHGLRVQAFCR